jgi:hypothetical protein
VIENSGISFWNVCVTENLWIKKEMPPAFRPAAFRARLWTFLVSNNATMADWAEPDPS